MSDFSWVSPALTCLYFFDMLLYPLFYRELGKYSFTFVRFRAECFNTGMMHSINPKEQEFTPTRENRSSEQGGIKESGMLGCALSSANNYL